MVLGQFNYTIVHISGKRNCWGDLLSRWVKAQSVDMRVIAVYARSEPDEVAIEEFDPYSAIRGRVQQVEQW